MAAQQKPTNNDKKAETVLDNSMKAHNSELGLEDAFNLMVSVGDCDSEKGVIHPHELSRLLKYTAENEIELRAYDGFEPSGRMHIAQGLMRTINVNKLTKSGVTFVFYVADWFAQLNNKMGGDLAKIREVGQYFVEVWRACGMDLTRVEFVWASEEINKRPDEYWSTVMDLARKNSVARIRRCGQIMGRQAAKDERSNLLEDIFNNREADKDLSKEEFASKYSQQMTPKSSADNTPVAQLLYPLMQCTDIFFLNARICQLGLDQLKVNVLAREYCDSFGKKDRKNRQKFKKPIILSHHMLMGLKEGQEKMSKSDPESAIFMEDSADDVRRKIKKAFCRPGDIKTNPILDYLKHIIFPCLEQQSTDGTTEFVVERSEKNGGSITYQNFADLESDFGAETLHPSDLKLSVAREINNLLEPVRKHFESGEPKALLKRIRSFKVTK